MGGGILAQKQQEDPNLRRVVEWLTEDNRPDWNLARGLSPPAKDYWNQYESLSLVSGVIYRTIAPKNKADEEFKQLVMPCGLKNEFLDAIHKDLAGHMGTTKTAAHVLRRERLSSVDSTGDEM